MKSWERLKACALYLDFFLPKRKRLRKTRALSPRPPIAFGGKHTCWIHARSLRYDDDFSEGGAVLIRRRADDGVSLNNRRLYRESFVGFHRKSRKRPVCWWDVVHQSESNIKDARIGERNQEAGHHHGVPPASASHHHRHGAAKWTAADVIRARHHLRPTKTRIFHDHVGHFETDRNCKWLCCIYI